MISAQGPGRFGRGRRLKTTGVGGTAPGGGFTPPTPIITSQAIY
jgi:hypothetical protein